MKNYRKALSIIPITLLLFGCSRENGIEIYSYNYSFKVTNSFDFLKVEDKFVARNLFDDSYLGSGLNDIEVPHDLIAGDSLELTIKYPGEIVIQTSYPGHALLVGGSLLSYKFIHTTVNEMEKSGSSWSETLKDYDIRPNNYVILDEQLHYTSIEEYDGDKLFYTNMNDDYLGRHPGNEGLIMGLYAYNPR